MDLASLIFLAGATLALALAALAWRARHRRRLAQDAATLAQAIEDERDIPPTLHPVIDPDVCIGSLSCVQACPEGDILGIVGHAATLVEPSNCIGHGRCALECPVGAIKLVFGTSRRGVDLPEVDEQFESSKRGISIAGELGGMGLIKNAINQGLQAGDFLARSLDAAPDGDPGQAEVVIVGAGPAGLAAAAALRRAGKRIRILEQNALGGTVAHYPRQKIVMTERAEIPGYGPFGKSRMSKEELLHALESLVARFGLEVETGARVTGVDGEDGRFVVHTDRGDVPARKVLLAIGRRGTPRKLGVPGEELEKVTYSLTDPTQYAGKRVLVIGGGDSALEAALALARERDAQVSLAYRGAAFGRCRAANREALEAERERGGVRVLLSTEVVRVEPRAVVLRGPQGEHRADNDFLIVCAGGELPLALLRASGVELVRHHGDRVVRSPSARPAAGSAGATEGSGARGAHLGLALFALGALIVGALTYQGLDYYLLPRALRSQSALHAHLKPSGPMGHGIGVVATLVMLSNFLYPLRKRWRRLKGSAPIARWLTFHVFVGILSPAVIVFHAAFLSNNTIANATFASLLVVVLTGLTGRFVYGLIPSTHGKTLELSQLTAQMLRLRAEAEREVARAANPARLSALVARLTTVGSSAPPLIAVFWEVPKKALSIRWSTFRLRHDFADRVDYTLFRHTALSIVETRTELMFYAALRRFIAWWRVLHVLLAVLLVLIIAVHIAVSIYLGYRWVLP